MRQVMMVLVVAQTCLGLSRSAHAVVTSYQAGSHVVRPGEIAFGVNLDGVALLAYEVPNADDLEDLQAHCTAALISDRHLLTAAHCLRRKTETGETIDVHDLSLIAAFETVGGPKLLAIDELQSFIPEEFDDLPADIAVMTLEAPAPTAIPRYTLLSHTNIVGKRVVISGYGNTGDGYRGVIPGHDRRPTKRAGMNRVEALRDGEPFPGLELFLYDFDSGAASHNALLELEIDSDLGFREAEVFSARGDSGGPIFIYNTIVGVTAFGARRDPAAKESWGALSFDVPVATFQEFIIEATNGEARFVIPGDYNADALIDLDDLHLLSEAIRTQLPLPEQRYDLNSDRLVGTEDLRIWVEDVMGTSLGDANLDGAVDWTDFSTLSRNFGERGTWNLGDFTADGQVVFDDFLVLSANFATFEQNDITTVPEPNGQVLQFLVLFLVCQIRPRLLNHMR